MRLVLFGALLSLAAATVGMTRHLRDLSARSQTVLASPVYGPGIVGVGGDAVTIPGSFAVPVVDAVDRGETLSGVFARLGLGLDESRAAALAVARFIEPRRLRAGSPFTAYLGPGEQLERVIFRASNEGEVQVSRAATGWTSQQRLFERERRITTVAGVLETALETSMRAAGAPAEVAHRLGDVFQWDLDFARDLRLGDRFHVVYEEIWLDGSRSGVGSVLAATYENRGRRFEAYRFDGGYYDGDGRPLRKQFLRSPLEFARVTSRFTHSRFHPVLKVYRPHLGVDYGAPTGTPVRATANGVVISASWTKDGGKTIKLRHPNSYATAYLHLSRYAAGIAPGVRVQQSQVIGFVGSTGLATAPHLDYRVTQAGRYINPLELKSEPVPPLSAARLETFLAARGDLRQRLAPPPQLAGGPVAGR